MAAAKIFGVEILNEGWGSSIDDAVSERLATFVACEVGQCWLFRPGPLFPSPFPPPPLSRSRGRLEKRNVGKSMLHEKLDAPP
jgi:hypothetical protein